MAAGISGQQAASKSGHKLFFIILYSVSFLVIAYLLVDGLSFYLTPYQQRPRHEDYRLLRPAGEFGHGVGIIGSAMMLFMLLYSLRKRTRAFGKWGNLRSWLDIHIYFGIIGPLLVILHTSFKVQGLIAVSFWSMIAVALSGVFGRYLYLQIPRDFSGEELDLAKLQGQINLLGGQLKDDLKLDEAIVARVEGDLTPKIKEGRGPVGSLVAIMAEDVARPLKIRRLRNRYASEFSLSPDLNRQLFDLARRRAVLNRKLALLDQVQQLFHYWHVFHKPFAIVMYIIMLIHIVVAIWLGYTWIF